MFDPSDRSELSDDGAGVKRTSSQRWRHIDRRDRNRSKPGHRGAIPKLPERVVAPAAQGVIGNYGAGMFTTCHDSSRTSKVDNRHGTWCVGRRSIAKLPGLIASPTVDNITLDTRTSMIAADTNLRNVIG